jgi:Ni/Co efflux regulator RcnB
MKNIRVATLVLGITGLVVTPGFAQKPPAPEQNQGQKADYHFRKEDSAKLRQHYDNIKQVDTRSRHELTSGGRLPDDWKGRMRPVPADVIRELAPPPAGYVFGYIDGYCVVYDPNTGYIADVIDLTNL